MNLVEEEFQKKKEKEKNTKPYNIDQIVKIQVYLQR